MNYKDIPMTYKARKRLEEVVDAYGDMIIGIANYRRVLQKKPKIDEFDVKWAVEWADKIAKPKEEKKKPKRDPRLSRGYEQHKQAAKKHQQYSGLLFKQIFGRLMASSASRTPVVEAIEDILIAAKSVWYSGKIDTEQWVSRYLGLPDEDFRFE
jgi:hypothetical protein